MCVRCAVHLTDWPLQLMGRQFCLGLLRYGTISHEERVLLLPSLADNDITVSKLADDRSDSCVVVGLLHSLTSCVRAWSTAAEDQMRRGRCRHLTLQRRGGAGERRTCGEGSSAVHRHSLR